MTLKNASRPDVLKFFVFPLAALLLALAGPLARADEARMAVEAKAQVLDRARATLDEVNASLADPQASAAELKTLSLRLRPLPDELQGVVDDLAPKIEETKARIGELAGQKSTGEAASAPAPAPNAQAPPSPPAPVPAPPPPKAGAKGREASQAAPALAAPAPFAGLETEQPAAARVKADLSEENRMLEELEALAKRARALLVETGQLQLAVLDRQRAVFKRELFRQTSSLFSTELWSEVRTDAPPAFTLARLLAQQSAQTFAERLRSGPRALVLAVVALIAGLAIAGSALAQRLLARGGALRPSTIEKAAGAALGALAIVATPLAVIGALAATLSSFDLVDPVARPFMNNTLEVAALTVVCYALARVVFAPAAPNWRLIDPGPQAARTLTWLVLLVAIVLALSRVVEQAAVSVGARLSLIIANRGMTAVVVALLLLVSLLRLRGTSTDAAVELKERAWFSLARYAAMAVVATIVIACALGYVTFAGFVVLVLAWLMMVLVSVRLFQALAAAAIEAGFKPESRLGQSLAGIFGREPLQLASVLFSGVVTLFCAAVGLIAALAPFGVESDAILTNLRASFYALNIGDVTVSPAAIAAAIALFCVVLAAAHALRFWLETKFLPLTRLDRGLRVAIASGASYLGLFLALVAALGYLGLGLDRLAILAGALSVGVGFGLQSVVNNFVSGIIILWEGAIRVGDWIAVGDEQGHVTRINVRATEIETFDRATMIIPNANLVSGSVKNWVRGDKVGRIKIALTQPASVDPSQIEDILLAAAKAQDGVLGLPAPRVMFMAMDRVPEGDVFRFELWCYVEDVEQSARVRSDLHFDLYRRLVEAKLLNPALAPAAVEMAQ